MWKSATTGFALLMAGAARFAEHASRTPTLEDYLAFRCGPGASAPDAGAASHSLLSNLHCWGCPAMAAGAALLALTAVRALRQAAGRSTPLMRS